MDAIALIFIAYLLGSISFATLCCRWLKIGDPKQMGSGNPGATNVLRIAGRKTALTVLIADASKGAITVLIGHTMGIGGLLLAAVALAALVGHCYPIWHRFKGGKGVATFMGGMLALNLTVGILVCAIWLCIALITRYASLASLLSAMFCPILLAKFADFAYVLPTCIMVAIIIYRHWDNILRLKAKEEKKITFSTKGKSSETQDTTEQDSTDQDDQPDEPQTKEQDASHVSAEKHPAHPAKDGDQDNPAPSKADPNTQHDQDDR